MLAIVDGEVFLISAGSVIEFFFAGVEGTASEWAESSFDFLLDSFNFSLGDSAQPSNSASPVDRFYIQKN